eukprot:362837-Chlamydomonas_euryale.AAC.1
MGGACVVAAVARPQLGPWRRRPCRHEPIAPHPTKRSPPCRLPDPPLRRRSGRLASAHFSPLPGMESPAGSRRASPAARRSPVVLREHAGVGEPRR